MTISDLLQPYQRFGVNLGLDRIRGLLARLGNPQTQVPVIHVGGTNGKGSVCAYLSSILTQAGYRVGRYTSPHLLDWTERICLNQTAIAEARLCELLQTVSDQAPAHSETSPTLFEIMTAAAWLYFAQENVDVAVVEVGLGGRLDATNVCDHPLLSIITSLSRDHWQVLGPTLANIAREKAGIFKPGCPALLGAIPTDVAEVFRRKSEQMQSPSRWIEPAQPESIEGESWANYQGIRYPLPLLGHFQLFNSALAIAAIQELRQQGWSISQESLEQGMGQAQWPGRLQWLSYQGHRILIDGAHNSGSAQGLADYVRGLGKPVQWVMGMLASKDHEDIFKALLRPDDQLFLLPVPGHSSADPEQLAALALNLCPGLTLVRTESDSLLALKAAFDIDPSGDHLTVLCGSLYLVGDFLARK